jgi:hypothetical protein
MTWGDTQIMHPELEFPVSMVPLRLDCVSRLFIWAVLPRPTMLLIKFVSFYAPERCPLTHDCR